MALTFGGLAIGGAMGALAGEGATFALARTVLAEWVEPNDTTMLSGEGIAITKIATVGKWTGALAGAVGGAAAGAYHEVRNTH